MDIQAHILLSLLAILVGKLLADHTQPWKNAILELDGLPALHVVALAFEHIAIDSVSKLSWQLGEERRGVQGLELRFMRTPGCRHRFGSVQLYRINNGVSGQAGPQCLRLDYRRTVLNPLVGCQRLEYGYVP